MDGVDACPDDNTPLVDERPADPEPGEVIVYELDEWTPDERRELAMRLTAEEVEHQWEPSPDANTDEGYEPTNLLVSEADEAVVDALLDEIEAAQPLAEVQDDGASDEAVYEVMSNLYVAADRLKDDPDDLALAGEFFDAADAAKATPAPFGIDPEVWRRVQALAGQLSESLEGDADDDTVRHEAQTLRDILFSYV